MTYSKIYKFSGNSENRCVITLSTGNRIKPTISNGYNSVVVFFCQVSDNLIAQLKYAWLVVVLETTRSPNIVERFRLEILDPTNEPILISTRNYIGNPSFPNYPYHQTVVQLADLNVEIYGPGQGGKLLLLSDEENMKLMISRLFNL